jgi:hypothetical protein
MIHRWPYKHSGFSHSVALQALDCPCSRPSFRKHALVERNSETSRSNRGMIITNPGKGWGDSQIVTTFRDNDTPSRSYQASVWLGLTCVILFIKHIPYSVLYLLAKSLFGQGTL